jgi:hypothetical protein
LGDLHLALRERGVDRREVRDQETQHGQPCRRLEEGQDVGTEVRGPQEAERQQRRPTHLERPLEALHAEGVEHGRERPDHHEHPHAGEHEQPDGAVERHHRVAPVVAAGGPGDGVEDHPEPDEHHAGDDRRRPPGQHERAQRRIEDEEQEAHAEHEPEDDGHDVHRDAA